MTREKAIECLNFQNEKIFGGQSEALKMAIASLKTDEAYQLEYENRDFVEISKGMTNGEVLQAVFPNCEISIGENDWRATTIDGFTEFTPEWWNAPYQKGGEE